MWHKNKNKILKALLWGYFFNICIQVLRDKPITLLFLITSAVLAIPITFFVLWAFNILE